MDLIVPIYKDGQFNGNGIIHKDYLITPAHVVRFSDSNDFYFIFDGNQYKLTIYDVCYCEYDDFNISEIRKDLIIFKTKIKNQVNINFYEIEKKDAYIKGFKPLSEAFGNLTFIEIKVNLTKNVSYQYTSNKRPVKQHNIFEFKSKEAIIGGMSGSPIFNGDILYGILLSELCCFNGMIKYHFVGLKASYIHRILQEIETHYN